MIFNWSVDTKRLKKNKKQYIKWKLEQLINYGLNNEKIDKEVLKKYLEDLHIDPDKKTFLKYLLYAKKSSD